MTVLGNAEPGIVEDFTSPPMIVSDTLACMRDRATVGANLIRLRYFGCSVAPCIIMTTLTILNPGMRTVGILEAKTHFSALIDRVAAGERVTITRHGKPVAQLVPPGDDASAAARHASAVDGLLALRKRYSLGRARAKELITEGRKR
jgi:prevent-host-death family protein